MRQCPHHNHDHSNDARKASTDMALCLAGIEEVALTDAVEVEQKPLVELLQLLLRYQSERPRLYKILNQYVFLNCNLVYHYYLHNLQSLPQH